jgi:predicted transcriptional regulator
MDTQQKQRQLRMEDELWERAQRAANDLDRSVSWVIRKALEEYIDRHLAAKREQRLATFDAEFDQANRADRKPVVASKRVRK